MSDSSLSDAITEIEVAKMTPAERRRYEAEIAYEIDQASKLECAINSGLKQGMQQGKELGRQEGRQEGKQELLHKYVQKRFPNLDEKLKIKLSLLNNAQLDQILEMFADYPEQSAFEAAVRGLETEDSK